MFLVVLQTHSNNTVHCIDWNHWSETSFAVNCINVDVSNVDLYCTSLYAKKTIPGFRKPETTFHKFKPVMAGLILGEFFCTTDVISISDVSTEHLRPLRSLDWVMAFDFFCKNTHLIQPTSKMIYVLWLCSAAANPVQYIYLTEWSALIKVLVSYYC